MIRTISLLLTISVILCGAVLAEDGAEATKFERILEEIASTEAGIGPAEYSVSQADFNSWLLTRTRDREYIHQIEASFHDSNQAELLLELDVNQLDLEGYYPKMLSTMFEGHQTIGAAGEIKVNEGKLSFVINNLTINEVHVTPALVMPLALQLLPNNDLTKPLPLPYGITDIRTSEGVLTIVRPGN